VKTNMETLTDLIKRHEGFRETVYKCPAGKLTVGYGHNLEDNPMSEQVAEMLLDEDIDEAIENLKQVIPVNKLKYENVVRFNALVTMMYIFGLEGFKGFRKMVAALKRDPIDWSLVAAEAMDSRWYRRYPVRASEIVRMLQFGVMT